MADTPWWFSPLTGALGGVIGFYFVFKMARYQADLARHREHQRAAITLLADLERIRAALEEHAKLFTPYTHAFGLAAPALHRWAEPAIAMLSSADPVIVGDCLRLDRQLQNFAGILETFRLFAGDLERARHACTAAEELGPVVVVNTRRELAAATSRYELALDVVRNAHIEVSATLQILLPRVSRIARLEEPALMELEEERNAREACAGLMASSEVKALKDRAQLTALRAKPVDAER